MSVLPKLLVFAPCERVVIGGGDDNSSSLIAILQGFEIDLKDTPTREPGQPHAAFPLTWYIFGTWENDFSGVNYHFHVELLSPRGGVLLEQKSKIDFTDRKRFNRFNIKVTGFPLDGFGDYLLRVSSSVDGVSYVERATFPIPINPPRKV